MRFLLISAALIVAWLATIAGSVLCAVLVFTNDLPPHTQLMFGMAFGGLWIATKRHLKQRRVDQEEAGG